MSTYSLSQVSDSALVHNLRVLLARDRRVTAELLAHLAEVDARKLYAPAGFPSMYEYCLRELHLTEQSALKRIHAARTARDFPVIFAALADGRMHLSTVILLKPHLTNENVRELVAAATHKTDREVELALAERFPRPDLPTFVKPIAPRPSELSARTDEIPLDRPPALSSCEVSARTVDASHLTSSEQLSVRTVDSPAPPARVKPLAPERYALQLTMSRRMHDKLRHIQDLLGRQVSPGDVAAAVEYAFDACIAQLEKRKFAATRKPRAATRQASGDPRHIPACVKRAVWARDEGQCTFVNDSGQRCPSKRFLEFDHVEPVARGGEASVSGIRLRCRAHNQYEAEQVFGAEFMRYKREARRENSASAGAPAG